MKEKMIGRRKEKEIRMSESRKLRKERNRTQSEPIHSEILFGHHGKI